MRNGSVLSDCCVFVCLCNLPFFENCEFVGLCFRMGMSAWKRGREFVGQRKLTYLEGYDESMERNQYIQVNLKVPM